MDTFTLCGITYIIHVGLRSLDFFRLIFAGMFILLDLSYDWLAHASHLALPVLIFISTPFWICLIMSSHPHARRKILIFLSFALCMIYGSLSVSAVARIWKLLLRIFLFAIVNMIRTPLVLFWLPFKGHLQYSLKYTSFWHARFHFSDAQDCKVPGIYLSPNLYQKGEGSIVLYLVEIQKEADI